MYEYQYPRAAITCDFVVTYFKELLVIKRKSNPYKDFYALPGGFLNAEIELLEECAYRELQEETGLTYDDLYLVRPIGHFDAPMRDSRSRVISFAFGGILKGASKDNIKAGDDAAEFAWVDLYNPPQLAFDHNDIVERAITVLQLEQV